MRCRSHLANDRPDQQASNTPVDHPRDIVCFALLGTMAGRDKKNVATPLDLELEVLDHSRIGQIAKAGQDQPNEISAATP